MTNLSQAENADNLPLVFEAGDLRIDVGLQQVTQGGERIDLPKLSFDLLIALLKGAPNLIPIEELMVRVWPGLVVNPETVSQRVKLLRDALGDDARAPHYIAGLRGRGYRFLLAVTANAPRPRFPAPTTPATEPHLIESAGEPQSHAPRARGRGFAATVMRHPRVFALAAGCVVAVGATILATAHWKPSNLARPSRTPVAVTSVSPRTVAVLPFESLNADHADDYLARGIPAVLVTRLGAARDLIVIASTSSFAVARDSTGAREIGRNLNAHYLVGGTVQREGQQLRVTAHVVDAESGQQLTALRFDRKVDEIFRLEDDIADQIATALDASIVGPGARRGGHDASGNLDAYLAYLKGKAYLRRWRIAETQAAIAELERAIKLDPTFAPAYADLAMAKVQSSSLLYQDNAHLADTVSPLIEKALSLDDTLAEAYVARGALESKTAEGAAQTDFLKGIALNPNYAAGYAMFAQALLGWRRNAAEGRRLSDRGLLSDPTSPQLLFLRAHFSSGLVDFEHFMLEALKVDPDYFPALKSLGWKIFIWRRQTAAAIELTERAIRLDPQDVEIRHSACDMYLDVGDLGAAQQVIGQSNARETSAPMMIAMYRNDWRTAGKLAYSIPARLRDESEGLEVGAAVYTYAMRTGGFARAEAYLRELWRIKPGDELKYDRGAIYIADLMRRQGRNAAAQLIFDGLPNVIQQRPDYNFRDSLMGVLMVTTGRPDAGLELLAREIDKMHHPYWYVVLGFDELLHSVRGDPRFEAILGRERAYSTQQRALLERMRKTGDVPVRAVASS